MKIAVGADHKGLEFKTRIIEILKKMGHEVIDMGTDSTESVDYPDFGIAVAKAVVEGAADCGVNICWTGNGMAIASNKVKGIRAGLALNPEMAHLTREHNDANVLVLSAKYTPADQLEDILEQFLTTGFEGGRHIRRLDKIKAVE